MFATAVIKRLGFRKQRATPWHRDITLLKKQPDSTWDQSLNPWSVCNVPGLEKGTAVCSDVVWMVPKCGPELYRKGSDP